MQNKNTRRGHTQTVVTKTSNIPELVSGSSTHAVTQAKQPTLKMPKQVRQYSYFVTRYGFTRSRHPEFISGPSRFMKGFTLIELLVVVLIIGILAAVALPQYQLAVAKARVAAILPMLKSITQANYAYYLANGELTENVNKLDISLSGDCASTTYTGTDPSNGQIWKCGTYWVVDNSGGESVIANYCPGNNQTWNTCALTRIFRVYTQWSPTTGYKVDCHPLNDSSFGQKVCNSLALN